MSVPSRMLADAIVTGLLVEVYARLALLAPRVSVNSPEVHQALEPAHVGVDQP